MKLHKSGLYTIKMYYYVIKELFGFEQLFERMFKIYDLKKQFGLHQHDTTLESFFASGNIDIEWFERIAAVSKTAVEAIKLYRTEVAAAQEETK